MELHVEAEQIAAEQAVEDLLAATGRCGTPRDCGHGMCQNWLMIASGRALLDAVAAAARSDSPARGRSAGEPSISSSTASANFALTRAYCSQSRASNIGPRVGDVAQRPQRALAKP